MSRWYDCPDCIGYCEEYIDDDGRTRCPSCGVEVWFEPAPEEVKQRLYRAGIWAEEIVCVKIEGEVAINPAFANQEQYNKWIRWNSIKMTAACDQLTALLTEDEPPMRDESTD